MRPGKDSKLDVKLKLIAGMFGVGLDELKQREAHRRQRQLMMLVTASVAGMAITSTLAGAAWLARNEAERQRVRAEAEAETARQTTRFMVDLFKVSDPSEALGNTITAREILDKGAKRIDKELADQPAIQATLMDTMGTVYTSLGLYESAVPLVRKAYERRMQLWGTLHPETASSLNHLGEVLTLRSDYDEAEKRLREALAARKSLFGPDAPQVAETLMALAEVLGAAGRVPAERAADPGGAGHSPQGTRRAGRIRTSRAASKPLGSTTTSAASTTRRSSNCVRPLRCSGSCIRTSRTRRWRRRPTTWRLR